MCRRGARVDRKEAGRICVNERRPFRDADTERQRCRNRGIAPFGQLARAQ